MSNQEKTRQFCVVALIASIVIVSESPSRGAAGVGKKPSMGRMAIALGAMPTLA